MRTVLKSRDFIVAAVLVLIISFFSFSISNSSSAVCSIANSTCPNLKQVTGSNGELLWDSFIRHILGSVSFR